MDHFLDAGLLERRHAGERLSHVLLEVIPVVVEELELEIGRNIAERPGDRVGLVASHDEPAHLFLEIGAPIGVADGRDVAGEPLHPFRDDVLMLHRLERHAHAGEGSHLPGPLARAVDHRFAGDGAPVGAHRCHAAIVDVEALDAHAFVELRAVHARALGEGLGDVGRARLAVGRKKGGADEVRDVHQRPHGLRLGRGEEVHLHAEALRRGGEALELDPAVLVAGEPQATGHLPAGGEPRLGIEPLVEIDRVFEHLGDRGRRAQLPDQTRGMPCRTGGDLVLLEEHDIGVVIARQVISRGAADDAAADHHEPGAVGERACHDLPYLNRYDSSMFSKRPRYSAA
jgi:hypothetical protein